MSKAEFVTQFGPRDMGPSPPVAQGLILYYIINPKGGGAKNTQINEKYDKHNDINEVWDVFWT